MANACGRTRAFNYMLRRSTAESWKRAGAVPHHHVGLLKWVRRWRRRDTPHAQHRTTSHKHQALVRSFVRWLVRSFIITRYTLYVRGMLSVVLGAARLGRCFMRSLIYSTHAHTNLQGARGFNNHKTMQTNSISKPVRIVFACNKLFVFLC